MSTKDQVSKRKEAYRAAIKKVKKDRELYDAFRKLNSAIPQRKNKSPMTMEDLSKMEEAYRACLKTLDTKMEALSDQLSNAPSGNKKQIEAKKKLDDRYAYYAKLRKTLSKDLKAVGVYVKMKPAPLPNVTQFYEHARSEKTEYDLRQAKKYGGGTSTRYRITNKDKEGFFTISRAGLSDDKKKQNAIEDINKKYGTQSIFNTHNKNNMAILASVLLKNDKIEDMIHDNFEEYVTRATFKNTRNDVKDEFIKTIEEANFSDDDKKELTELIWDMKPGEMLSLLEYMEDSHKIDNVADINNTLGINTKSKLDKRNSAMSMVADLLGRKDLLASAQTLQIKDPETGKIISGTFMEKANGVDRESAEKEDLEKFNELTPEKIENSLQLKKDIADMQIIDWIGGNPDRNYHNIFYKFDEKGNMCGIVGIDNDLSFGKNGHGNVCEGIYLENMSVITEEMADKLMNMNKEEFKNMLFGYDLSTAEVNKALHRLEVMQQKIVEDKEYFKDMPLGYVEDGRIRIMNDDQLKATSLYGDLAGGKIKMSMIEAEGQAREDKNIFATIAKYGMDANGIDYSIKTATAGIYEDNVSVIREATLFDKRLDAMEASERKSYKGKQPFRDMITAMKNVKNAFQFIENGMAKPKNDGRVIVSEDNINIYKAVLTEAMKKCDDYMDTKDINAIKKLSKKSNGYERYMLAKESKEGMKKALKYLDGMIEKKNLIEDYEVKYEGHKITCQKQLENIKVRDAARKNALQEEAKKVLDDRAKNQEKQMNIMRP